MVANQGIGPFPSFLSVMLIGCQGCAGTNTATALTACKSKQCAQLFLLQSFKVYQQQS